MALTELREPTGSVPLKSCVGLVNTPVRARCILCMFVLDKSAPVSPQVQWRLQIQRHRELNLLFSLHIPCS